MNSSQEAELVADLADLQDEVERLRAWLRYLEAWDGAPNSRDPRTMMAQAALRGADPPPSPAGGKKAAG